MTRLAIGLFTLLEIASWSQVASAQTAAPAPASDKAPAADAPPPADAPPADQPTGDTDLGAAAPAAPPAEATLAKRYEDIVVVPRKKFLKAGRFELAPLAGMSLNDVLIKHYSLGGQLNFFLSDVFWIGLEGQYFIKQLSERESLVGLQYYRVPTLNKYIYSAALDFGYAPVYGKFSLFNRYIMGWEMYASAGIGITQSEIIPRNAGDASFKSNLITPNFGAGARFFLFDWMTVNFAVRDYVFSDKFEPTARKSTDSIATVQANADSQLINNVLFYAGVGFYLPTGFDYRTPR